MQGAGWAVTDGDTAYGDSADGDSADGDSADGDSINVGGSRAAGRDRADGSKRPAADVPMRRRAPVRLVVWALHLAVPLLGLWLLVSRPALDVVWRHPPSHFWLVMVVAGVNVGLGLRMSEAATRRDDARLFLVALAFLASAGFLFLHALATPGILLNHPNAGFVVATPVGLFLASVFAFWSSLPFTPARSSGLLRRQALLRGGLVLLLAAWAVVSVADLPPLSSAANLDEAGGWLKVLAVTAVCLYAAAAVRYWLLYRDRPSVMLISVITSFALLAEAMVASTVGRDWALSWWEWHLLMTFAFGYVAYSAHVQYQREGSSPRRSSPAGPARPAKPSARPCASCAPAAGSPPAAAPSPCSTSKRSATAPAERCRRSGSRVQKKVTKLP